MSIIPVLSSSSSSSKREREREHREHREHRDVREVLVVQSAGKGVEMWRTRDEKEVTMHIKRRQKREKEDEKEKEKMEEEGYLHHNDHDKTNKIIKKRKNHPPGEKEKESDGARTVTAASDLYAPWGEVFVKHKIQGR